MRNVKTELIIHENKMSNFLVSIISLCIAIFMVIQLKERNSESLAYFTIIIPLYFMVSRFKRAIEQKKLLKINELGITIYKPRKELITWNKIENIIFSRVILKNKLSKAPYLQYLYGIIYLNKIKQGLLYNSSEIKTVFLPFLTSKKELKKTISLYWQKKTKDQELNEYFEEKNAKTKQ